LSGESQQWVEESRTHNKPYGITYDNRARFNIDLGHSAGTSTLWRIASPVEISEPYLNFMCDNLELEAVVELFGPNIILENAKINSKQSGDTAEVKFRQNFYSNPIPMKT
jgi:hypothetical protein